MLAANCALMRLPAATVQRRPDYWRDGALTVAEPERRGVPSTGASQRAPSTLTAPINCIHRFGHDMDRAACSNIVAKCMLDGEDIGEWMVLRGWAVAYVYYSYEYTRAEATAKAGERGIWASEFEMPWEWRKMMSGNDAPGDCHIKGNINSEGVHIYHVPGGKWYDRTKVSTEKGERWFCSEAEAADAGWRASRE